MGRPEAEEEAEDSPVDGCDAGAATIDRVASSASPIFLRSSCFSCWAF
jgi:hypothetical protein